MLEDFYGQLWFVAIGKTCEIHFEATANMDKDKKNELLSMSSTGRNAAAKGLMARIGDLISGTLHGFGKTLDSYGKDTIRYGVVHAPDSMLPNMEMVPIWTLSNYRTDLAQAREADDAAEAALDDLERSIIARLADDIVVGVKGDRVDLVVTKRF